MAETIEQLKIYQTARELEDSVYKIVKNFPDTKFTGLGNDLRRSSSAVTHHIVGAHRLFSYRFKLDELAAMRREATAAQQQLVLASEFNDTKELIKKYDAVIQQSTRLSKVVKAKFKEMQDKPKLVAKDRLTAAAAL